jgi:phosphopantothenoylcysteine decarboxylase/phosphopantothenate--cysteine ligase
MLSFEGPVLIAPAMNCRMYRNPVVQKSIKKMEKRGVILVGPEKGTLACGDEGEGRMSETEVLVESVVHALAEKDLKGKKVLVTAGPTRESIDAVRYISNRSSGKMGYAIALAAFRRGAEVTLITGPSSERPPQGVQLHPVETAGEMEKAVLTRVKKADALVMAAAVSDISPARPARGKLDKNVIVDLKLKKTADILKKAGEQKGKAVLVGFAAESGMDIRSAKEKLKNKNLDLIVLNDISKKDSGFDVDTNEISIIDRKGNLSNYPLMQKIEAADIILDRLFNR